MIEKILLAGLAVLALAGFLYAGMADRTNTIIYTMKPEIYCLIKDKGFETDREIADEYINNKASYDQLAEQNLW